MRKIASKALDTLVSLAVLASASSTFAALNDAFPADFTALPEGSSNVALYLYDRQQDGTWSKGKRTGDLHGSSAIWAARFSRFYQFGDWKLAPVVVLSGLDLELSGNSVPANVTRQRAGLGDVRLGGSVWLIDDPKNRRFLALNVMTVWSTGRYENRELANPGENRQRQALTLGWIQGLSESVTLDLIPELAWYGKNPGNYPGNVRLEQDLTVSLTGYLRYRFSPQWQGFIGAQANEGGETSLNGVAQNNPIHGRRHFLGGTHVVDASNSINLRLAADSALTSGLKTTRELTLRWVHAF